MTYEINYNNTFWKTFELGLNFEPASQFPVGYLVSEYPLMLWHGHSSVLHHDQIQLPAQLGSGVRTVCWPLCSWLITLSNLRDHQLLHHFVTNVWLWIQELLFHLLSSYMAQIQLNSQDFNIIWMEVSQAHMWKGWHCNTRTPPTLPWEFSLFSVWSIILLPKLKLKQRYTSVYGLPVTQLTGHLSCVKKIHSNWCYQKFVKLWCRSQLLTKQRII